MTALPVGGPDLPQRCHLVTEIPGPASRALSGRRASAVARGVSSTLPVYITSAGGGVLVDVGGNSLIDFGSGIAGASVGAGGRVAVDGNSLIDFGPGIAVASVGNAAAAVVDHVQAQVARFTHTC